MKCPGCRVTSTCAYESRRRMCDAPGGPYFGAHATGGEALTQHLYPDAFGPDFSQGNIPLAETLRLKLLVAACDYRGPISQCGCTEMHVCFLGRGTSPGGGPGPDVALSTCLECVRWCHDREPSHEVLK